MLPNTKYRTDQPEIMDDFNLEGDLLKDALDKIANINQLLGGNKITIQGLKYLLNKVPTATEISICDVGCGNGDMLRKIADYGLVNNLNLKLTGIDANDFTIRHSKKMSLHYPNITYSCENIFDDKFQNQNYDIVLCTLTLHHFKDEEILKLMRIFHKQTSIGIIINDLHRSTLAYKLFQGLCYVFRLNEMSRQDGLVSILRGFKKAELLKFSKQLNIKQYKIQWKWAFRYQWIISKI